MVRDVLDLVRDRAGVDLAELRESVQQRVPGDVEAEQLRGDARLELRSEWRTQSRLVERGIAGRLGAERVEARVQVPVGAIRLDEGHRGGDSPEQLVVCDSGDGGLLDELLAGRSSGLGLLGLGLLSTATAAAGADAGAGAGAGAGVGCGEQGHTAVTSALLRCLALDARLPGRGVGHRREQGVVAALEELAPGRVDCFGVLEVLLEKRAHVPRVEVELLGSRSHYCLCTSAVTSILPPQSEGRRPGGALQVSGAPLQPA